MKEEWRPVDGFFYEVSNFGSCRRIVTGNRLTPSPNKKGYLRVFLQRDGRGHTRYLHRLVAAAFVGPCPEGHETNHKNGIKADNTAWNLEYKTSSANNQHAWDTGLMPRTRKRRTHCRRGHLLVVPVREWKKRSGRFIYLLRCKECPAEALRKRMAKQLVLDHLTGGSEFFGAIKGKQVEETGK